MLPFLRLARRERNRERKGQKCRFLEMDIYMHINVFFFSSPKIHTGHVSIQAAVKSEGDVYNDTQYRPCRPGYLYSWLARCIPRRQAFTPTLGASGIRVIYTTACRRYADVLVHRLLTCLVEWEGLKQPTERHDEGQTRQMMSDAVPTERRDEKPLREGKQDKDRSQQRRKRADSTQEEQDDTQGCSEEFETSEEEEEIDKDGEPEEMSEEVKAFREHVMQVCGTAVSSRDTPVSSLVLMKSL